MMGLWPTMAWVYYCHSKMFHPRQGAVMAVGYNVCMSLALSSSLSWFIVSSVGFYQDQSDRESDSSSVITARRHSGEHKLNFSQAPGQSNTALLLLVEVVEMVEVVEVVE